MPSVLPLDSDAISELRQAVKDCQEHQLPEASKWASDLLLAIPSVKRKRGPEPIDAKLAADSDTSTPVFSRHRLAPKLEKWKRPTERPESVKDSLKLARVLMENRQYLRVNNIVHERAKVGCLQSLYFQLYAQFLASEVHRIQPWQEIEKSNHAQRSNTYTNTLIALLTHILNYQDPWLLYLKALFLSRLSRREEAIESALLSIALYPWNWATWSLLSSLIGDGEELQGILSLLPLPHNHPLVYMFQIKTGNDLHTPTDHEYELCEQLLERDHFPDSVWLASQRACALYYQHSFAAAEKAFDFLLKKDPYRIEYIDLFSNILYVTQNSIKLSRLAHEYVTLEKDRPEVCCLLGNHHSIRAEHTKAIMYFRRATQLDRTFLSAWTLMGHEYVEMKNPHAAVAAYRNAIGVNRRDYRAWYGLGQVYELLSMHNYALYYYQHATSLKPYDPRLWQAEAACYKDMGKYRDAIECLRRALIPAGEDQVGIVLKLADLHHLLGDWAAESAYHRRVVHMCTLAAKPIEAFAFSCLQVADFEMFKKSDGDLSIAEHYCTEVAKTNAEETTRAADMLRELEKIKKARLEAEAIKELEAKNAATRAAQLESVQVPVWSEFTGVPPEALAPVQGSVENDAEVSGDVSMNSVDLSMITET